MKPRDIIIDTDPGIDDAAAIAVAIMNPNLNVKLITTVGANVEIEKTTNNALRLVEFFDVDIPVARGCGEPLLHKLEPCPQIHGVSGMDGYDFPPTTRKPVDKHAVEALRETIMGNPGKTTLVVIGSQTNIAILFRLYPEVKEKIDEIVTMGGGLTGGNTNSVAEFNIYNDPHAAAIVFSSGVPITMLGLNVTNHAILYRHNSEKIKASGRAGEMMYGLFTFYKGGSLEKGLTVHDINTIAYLLKPELYKTEDRYIEIATEGIAQGAMITDMRYWLQDNYTPNVKVCTEVDGEKFEEWFVGEFCRDGK